MTKDIPYTATMPVRPTICQPTRQKSTGTDGARRIIFDACGGSPDKLVKAMAIGMVRGIAALIGPFDPNGAEAALARDLIREDILVLIEAHPPIAGASDLDDPETAGVGLAEFCHNCGLTPVVAVDGLDIAGLLGLCAPLASSFGVAASRLPVAASGRAVPSDAAIAVTGAPADAPQAISRRIAARRLALGLNDRLDGTVYS